MNPYFYSLQMLITGRQNNPTMPWSAMDALADCIADETKPVPEYFAPLLKVFMEAKK